jgi:AraC family transcriptional regulator
MQARVAVLFRSPTLEIVDWVCAHHVGPFAGQEWNDVHEVVVVRRGAYVRRVAGDDAFVDAGTVAFGHPDETYRVRHPLPGGDACSAFRVPAAVAAELVRPDVRAGSEPRVRFPAASAPLDGRGYLLHRLAARAAADPRALPLEVEELALGFFQAAIGPAVGAGSRAATRRRPGRFPRAMERVWVARELLARRYRERLTLDDFARATGCSPFHLSRLFRAVTGVPIHRAQRRLRLRDALERLLSTTDGVSAVAYATGFASHSHLSDAFRREYGCPPSAIRRLSPRAVARLQPHTRRP